MDRSRGRAWERRPTSRWARQSRVLIIGHGDIGQRITLRAAHQARWILCNRTRPELAATGGTSAFGLDGDRIQARLSCFRRVVYLAPPPPTGATDPALELWLAACARHRARSAQRQAHHWVYMSTTGVYGSTGANWVDESQTLNPTTARGIRRAAAEDAVRTRVRRHSIHASVLRVPGIYGDERLPIERLKQQVPARLAEDDVYSNHIHADDLARTTWVALWRGRQGRTYNVVDQSDLKMGEYFDLVASALNLPKPPRLATESVRAQVSEMAWSFMNESRRLRAHRLVKELRIRLQYPTVQSYLQTRAAGLRTLD